MLQSRVQLVEAARRGESGAVLELLQVYQPDLKRFARRICSSSEDAKDAVQVALWRLYRHREVLILRDVHELTAPEAAIQLGLSVEAVKSRLHRARHMVRERLLSSGYWLKDRCPESMNS